MQNRKEILLALRPEIKGIDLKSSSSLDEQFQNQTLRPILKFQHDLLMNLLLSIIKNQKKDSKLWTEDQIRIYVSNLLTKNISFRNLILGSVIGLFTKSELSYFVEHKATITKRLAELIIERMRSGLINTNLENR